MHVGVGHRPTRSNLLRQIRKFTRDLYPKRCERRVDWRSDEREFDSIGDVFPLLGINTDGLLGDSRC